MSWTKLSSDIYLYSKNLMKKVEELDCSLKEYYKILTEKGRVSRHDLKK